MRQQLEILREEAERQDRSLNGFPILALGWSNILSKPDRLDRDRQPLNGTAVQVTEDLLALRNMGMLHVGLFFRRARTEDDFRRQMQVAAGEIMPALARSAS